MENSSKWYVMQVRTGTEENICIQCRKDIPEDVPGEMLPAIL